MKKDRANKQRCEQMYKQKHSDVIYTDMIYTDTDIESGRRLEENKRKL